MFHDRATGVSKSLSAAQLINLLREVGPSTRVTPNQVNNLALFRPDADGDPMEYIGYIDVGVPEVVLV